MIYSKKANDANTAVLYFYGEIGQWENSGEDFNDTITRIEAECKNLEIRLHCYGGSVFEGNVIFNRIARTTLEVIWHIDGVAASMGGIIPLSKGKVVMAENAFWMVHVPRVSRGGTAKELFANGKLLKSMEQTAIKAFVRKTGKTESEIATWFDGGDYWFDAEECEAMGLADEIAEPVEVDSDAAKGKPVAGTPVDTVYGRYTALLAVGNTNKTKIKEMDKQQIISQFSLDSITAASSDTAVLEALNGKFSALKTENQTLKAAAEASKKAQVVAVVAAKEVSLKTKFTDAQKASFEAVGITNGIDVLTSVLETVKPVANLKDFIVPEGGAAGATGGEDRSKWTFDDWQQKDDKGLEELAKNDNAAFLKLYKAKWPDAEL